MSLIIVIDGSKRYQPLLTVLDKIGDMPLSIQARILRVLERAEELIDWVAIGTLPSRLRKDEG